MQVGRDKHVIDQADTLQDIRRLRDDLLPVRAVWIGDVNGNDLRQRCVEVGHEVEKGTIVADEGIVGIEFVEQLDDLSLLRREVLVKDPVLTVRALPDRDDQVAAVVGDATVEAPLLVVGSFIDQLIGRLGRADAVIVEFVVVVRSLVGQPLPGLGVATVEKPLPVVGPGSVGELDPLQVVFEVSPTLYLTNPPSLPVGAGGREPVGQLFPIFTDRIIGERHRAIFRKLVGIEKNLGFVLEGLSPVEDALVL